MPHDPRLRAPLSAVIMMALTFQAAALSLPRIARAEDAPDQKMALLVRSLSWATSGLTMTGELLHLIHNTHETITVDETSTDKPAMLCFPIDAAPIAIPPATPADPTEEPPVDEPEEDVSEAPAPQSPLPDHSLSYSLNEAVSNPSSGKEWIEIIVSPSAAAATDRDLELWDAAGRIAQIPAGTDVVSGYLIVTLPSAKLNNGGDDLSLRTPLGLTLGETVIPSLAKGEAWAKVSGNTWAITSDLTPGAANRFPAPAPEEPEPEPEPETETPEEPEETPEEPPTPNPQLPTPTPPPSIGPHLPAFLSEAMSRPSDGKEWVELFIPTDTATTLGRELQLWDAAGRIATLGADTPVPASGYLLVTLSSAKLNNGGDDLSLRTADGTVLDSTEIPAVDEGSTWARTNSGQWIETTVPTPGEPNAFPSVAGATNSASGTTVSSASSSSSKSSSAKTGSDNLDLDLTDMPDETFINRRVRLVGTVGSIPNLLGSTHAFILLGEDGRAAIAYLPKHLHVPPIGTTVRVMGTLTATVKQLELRMKTTDVWMTVATSTPPAPRTVDFLAPGAEDAWSLTQARGTVTKTASGNFTLNVDGVDLTVSIPSAVGYRVSRLDKGDVVHVTGLMDPRKSSATILPRTADDIQLAEHASDSITAPVHATKTGFPDWVPFGAAVGAVVSTGVAKRAYSFFKKKQLERLVVPTAAPATQ